jgi:hypothetical protein
MPDSYFQLSTKNQASAIDAASEASGRAPHLLEKDTSTRRQRFAVSTSTGA